MKTMRAGISAKAIDTPGSCTPGPGVFVERNGMERWELAPAMMWRQAAALLKTNAHHQ